MRSTFKATVIMLLRTPSALVWALAFPVLMATLFMFMFSSMRNDGSVDAVPVAVVADAAWDDSMFAEAVGALADEGGDASGDDSDAALLAVTEVETLAEARDLLDAGEVDGVFRIDGAGEVQLTVAPEYSSAHQGDRGRSYGINRSILETVASSYTQSEALLEDLVARDPAALSDSQAVERALSLAADTEHISLTRGTPDETVRYYYALMGMATMFVAQLSMIAVSNIRPTASAVAARRCIAGTSRIRQLAGALLGSWVLSAIFLSVAFAFIRFVVGIDFEGREGLCLLALAAGACMATGLGALVGSLPLKGSATSGSGILTGLTCVLSIFAGLYGEPTMRLADSIARAVPVSAWINPTKLVCDLFYSLYFYESLVPFAARLLACVAWGAVLFACAAPLFRRHRYAHL